MSTFEVKVFDKFATKCKEKVFKLYRDGKSLYDEFRLKTREDKNLKPELGDIYANIEDIANGLRLPPKKYKKLNVGKLKYPLFETKSKNLRVYSFNEPNYGMVLITGGIKGSQDEDKERAKQIIKEYTIFVNSKK